MAEEFKDPIVALEERLNRLLQRSEHAFIAALPLAGVLAVRGKPEAVKRLPGRAMQLELSLEDVLLGRIRECVVDLWNSSDEDLGIAVVDAQGLFLTCRFLDRPSETLLKASEELAEADEAPLDEEALDYIQTWQSVYRLPEANALTFPQLANPLLRGERLMAEALKPPLTEHRLPRGPCLRYGRAWGWSPSWAKAPFRAIRRVRGLP